MKILFAASECVPFMKTGGLADVVGSLPGELRKKGADARVVLPKYSLIDREIRSRMEHLCDFYIRFGAERKYCGVEQLVLDGITFWFIDNEEFFAVGSIYGDGVAEGLRFAFFSRAVLEMLPRVGWIPDVLHLNDWQTGLIAALLKTQYGDSGELRNIRTVYTIHNLKYQGLFDWRAVSPRLSLGEWLFSPDYLEYYGALSFMKGGLVFADRITTVSPSYADEIRIPYYGEGLDGLLRVRSGVISGILNGIDRGLWNPQTDALIEKQYSEADVSGKAACKTALQREISLFSRPEVPVIGMITRLTGQKGLDLVECVLQDIMRMDVQLVFLGSGEQRYTDMICEAQKKWPGRCGSWFGLNEGLAHRIYAGSDMFLMPSQFEPCGLSQLIALRYGSVPIVRETGGLRDTVQPYNRYTDEGTGFSFANYNAHEMLYAIEKAVGVYYNEKSVWARLMKRGMSRDFGWSVSADRYLALYGEMTGIPQERKPERKGRKQPGGEKKKQ